MPDLSFVLSGPNTQAAADELAAALDGGDGIAIRRETPEPPHGAEHKAVVDPVAVLGVVLAIPGAVLAVLDIVDRLKKRRKAQHVIETAQRLRTAHHVEIVLRVGATSHDVATLDADRLLDLAGQA